MTGENGEIKGQPETRITGNLKDKRFSVTWGGGEEGRGTPYRTTKDEENRKGVTTYLTPSKQV